jgi:hypothetical protein
MELKIAGSGDETLPLPTEERLEAAMTFIGSIRQHLNESVLDSSAVVYVTYFPAWKRSFHRTESSSLSKIPPEKMDDSRSHAFPVKSAIYHVRKAPCSRTGWNPLRLPAVQPRTPLPDEHMPDTHIWRLIPRSQIPGIGFPT